MTPEQFEAMFQGLKKAIVERALGAELTHHFGYAKREEPPADQSNHRNGTSPKTVLTDTGPLNLAIPRDREGSFEPQLIPKGERRFKGFDEKIIAMYARGMTVREIFASVSKNARGFHALQRDAGGTRQVRRSGDERHVSAELGQRRGDGVSMFAAGAVGEETHRVDGF